MTFNHQLEDSCNAMDHNISCNIQTQQSVNLDLSFNGKIPELTSLSTDENIQLILKKTNEAVVDKNVKTASPEKKCVNIEESESEEKLRNESFELLKQEGDSKMMLITEGEKLPEVTETNCDDLQDEEEMESDEQQTTDYQILEHSEDYSKFNINTETIVEVPIMKIPTPIFNLVSFER
jgi:hypothetical protein